MSRSDPKSKNNIYELEAIEEQSRVSLRSVFVNFLKRKQWKGFLIVVVVVCCAVALGVGLGIILNIYAT